MKQAARHRKCILGIDPGTSIMGFGVLHKNKKKLQLVTLDFIKITKTSKGHSNLQIILKAVNKLVQQFDPDEMAIEAPFYGKNAQSMLKLGRAQGVAIAAALNKGLPVYEYAPKKIKMSITGKGYSSKKQVAGMLQQLLNFKKTPKYYDATDGLAVAVCHALQGDAGQQKTGGSKHKSWKSFIEANPGRLKE